MIDDWGAWPVVAVGRAGVGRAVEPVDAIPLKRD